jgi:catecholate siderophore receptor
MEIPMPTGITASQTLNRLGFAPTLLALAGAHLVAEEQPAPAPTPAPTITAPSPGEAAPPTRPATSVAQPVTLTVQGEQERTPKVDQATATRLDLDLQHTPQSVTVINQDLLKTTGAFTLRDALRTAPGVTLAEGEGGRTGDSLTIRGFAANSDTYVDNLKDNGQYFRDTFNIEQVEVLKGPSGLYFGRGVTGGAVNSVTKKPTATWIGDVSATAGTDELWRIQAGVGGPVTERIGTRVDAYVTDANSFRDDVESSRWGVAPTATVQLLTSTSLTLQYVHQFEDSSMDYGVPVVNGRPADVPIDWYYGFADDSFQEYTVDLYTATLDHRCSEQVSLRNATRYGDYNRYYMVEIPGAYNAGTGQVPITQALRNNDQDNVINNTELAFHGTLDERKLSVVAGVDFSWEEYAYQSKNANPAAAPISVFNPQQPDHNPGAPTTLSAPLNTDNHTDADNQAAYLMVAYEFVRTWTAVVGVRVDRFHAEVENKLTSITQEQTDTMVNPRAGLVWDPVPEVSLYGSYATSSNPTAETYNISTANAGLDPEENVSYEIGAKTELFDRALLLTAAVFRLEKTNARTPDPSNTTVNVLEGVQRTDGFEIGAAGRLSRDWTLFAGYAYMDGEVVESNTAGQEGNDSPNTPAHSGSVWLSYALGAGFDLGAGVYAKSSSYTNAANTTELPGYARFDLGAGWSGRQLFARVNVFNLFDTVHYDAGSTNFVYPGVPLSGQVTVGATF